MYLKLWEIFQWLLEIYIWWFDWILLIANKLWQFSLFTVQCMQSETVEFVDCQMCRGISFTHSYSTHQWLSFQAVACTDICTQIYSNKQKQLCSCEIFPLKFQAGKILENRFCAAWVLKITFDPGKYRNDVCGIAHCLLEFRVRTDNWQWTTDFQDFPGPVKTKFQGFPGPKKSGS